MKICFDELIGFIENQADSGILQCGTRFSIIFISINQYSL